MKIHLLAFASFVPFLLPACTTYTGQYYVGSDNYVLATHEGENGARDTFHLDVRSSIGDASLRVTSEYQRERPFLGFQLLDLDGQAAAHRGVQPFSGLLVKGVYPQSSAAQAGVLAGDVLLSLDGKPMVYLVQVAEFEASLRGEQVVAAKVLRGQSELDLDLATRLLRERVSDSQDIALESVPSTGRPFAGVGLRGIPAVWCEKIFGKPCNAVVVTTVEVGSPAWLAGIRGGDVVEDVDGAPVPPVAELSRRLHEQGAAGTTTHWRVRRGPSYAHEAQIELADYSGEANVWVPLVFRLQDGVYSDRWSVGPFGLLMSNRNHYVADTSSRRVQTRNVWNAILGLLHVETSPDRTQVRLLWLIQFEV